MSDPRTDDGTTSASPRSTRRDLLDARVGASAPSSSWLSDSLATKSTTPSQQHSIAKALSGGDATQDTAAGLHARDQLSANSTAPGPSNFGLRSSLAVSAAVAVATPEQCTWSSRCFLASRCIPASQLLAVPRARPAQRDCRRIRPVGWRRSVALVDAAVLVAAPAQRTDDRWCSRGF